MPIVVMDAAGRITLPDDLRRALAPAGEMRFAAETRDDGSLTLSPIDEDVGDPAVLRERLRRVEDDYAAGRTFRMTPDELEQAAELAGH